MGTESGARQDGPSAAAPGKTRRGDLVLCPPGPFTQTPITQTPFTQTNTVDSSFPLSRCLGPGSSAREARGLRLLSGRSHRCLCPWPAGWN